MLRSSQVNRIMRTENHTDNLNYGPSFRKKR